MSLAKRAVTRASIVAAAVLVLVALPTAVLAVDPVAVDDEFTIPVNSETTSWDVMANDTGNSLDLVDNTTPQHGSAVSNGGRIHYTPETDYRGTDTFDYTIDDGVTTDVGTVTVIVNNPPVAVDDPSATCQDPANFGGSFPIPEDYLENKPFGDYLAFALSCELLANDSDPDDDPLSIEIVDGPSHGDILTDPQIVAYRPAANYSTPEGDWVSDTVTYRAFDGLSYSNVATLRIWVAPVNDPPTFTPGGDVTVAEDSGAYSDQWATDIDPGPGETDQTVSFELQPSFPVEAFCSTGPLFVDLPTIDTDGMLAFSVRPNCSGTAHVTFSAKDDGGTTPDYSFGALTPDPDDTADDVSFDITVTAEADEPVAGDDSVTVVKDGPATAFDVLANDDDADGDTLTITGTTDGAKGVVAITGGGSGLTYDPDPGLAGADSFTYTVSDGHGGSDTATVTVSIVTSPNALNDVGLSVPESAGPTALDVLANDFVVPGDTLTITGKTNGAHGAVAITGGGTGLTYDPAQLYVGTDQFTYTVSDGHGGIDVGTVLLTVVKDTVKPTVVAPSEAFSGQTVKTSTSRLRISWAGSDAGTGIAKYKLQVSVNGGSYQTVTLPSPTTTSIKRTHADKATYRYRVRATDREDNASAYVYGPTFEPRRVQNTSSSIVYSGSWTTVKRSAALGGSHRYASSPSASARLTRTVRDFALVATKTASSGSVQVWIDGSLAATVNLHASSTTYRKVVFSRHFTSLASHTIEIRPAGNGRVYLDAFLLTR